MSTRANRVRNIGITGRGKGRLQPRTAVEDERMVLRTTLRYLRQHKVRAVGLGAAGAGLGVTLYSISRYPAVRSGASESPPGLASLVQVSASRVLTKLCNRQSWIRCFPTVLDTLPYCLAGWLVRSGWDVCEGRRSRINVSIWPATRGKRTW